MGSEIKIDWPTCTVRGCDGSAVHDGKCIAHVAGAQWADLGLKPGASVDARGVTFDLPLFERLLGALKDTEGRVILGDALFHRATFQAVASFGAAKFTGCAHFLGTSFKSDALFGEAEFCRDASFGKAVFEGEASFSQAKFLGAPPPEHPQHKRAARFGEATFKQAVWFTGDATFVCYASFDSVTFEGDARFHDTIFKRDASFRRARFQRVAAFHLSNFHCDATFDDCIFEAAHDFGPALVGGTLGLRRAVFEQRVTLSALAYRAVFARTLFAGGATVRLRSADVALDGAEFAGQSILVGEDEPLPQEPTTQIIRDTRVVSLRSANVESLTLSHVDLHACRFFRAHNLDRLRVEGDCEFARKSPKWWQTTRDTLAEERQWRERSGKKAKGWELPETAAPEWLAADNDLGRPDDVQPRNIAAIYRDLRKGREDRGDSPGAGDFYYGEMEMRRKADPPGWERVLLPLYWLASGYGQRASRALIGLAVTIVVGALLFKWVGFDGDKGRPEDGPWIYAVESSLSLLRRPDEADLTVYGHLTQIGLRLLGPLFFGLALLALRARVKR